MEYFENLLPPGAESNEGHVGNTDCPCRPEVIFYQGKTALFHHFFDNREIWMAAEMILGYVCTEHALHVDSSYVRNTLHDHIPPPEPVFEYDHNKIDPR